MDTDIHLIRSLITEGLQNAPKPDPSTLPYTAKDIEIPVRDGSSIAARVHTPKDASADGCPGMVVFHGGGYMVGDIGTEEWLCRLFSELGGVSVDVRYRHAPEYPFPQQVEDAHDATKWVRSESFVVGGKRRTPTT